MLLILRFIFSMLVTRILSICLSLRVFSWILLLQCRGVSRVKVCVRPPASISPAALERRSLPDKRPVAIVVEAPFRELRSGQPRLLEFGWEAIRPGHPKTAHGVPKVDDRSARNGILCCLGSGAPCAARQGPRRRCAQTCGINRWRKAAVRKRSMEEAHGRGAWGRQLGQCRNDRL